MLRVLCVRFSSIGDVLLTTPLVRALHRRHPAAELYFVTKRAMAPLVIENPHLDRVIELEPNELVVTHSPRDLVSELKVSHPSILANLRGR